MTPQATNRRERGLTSCCGHSWEFALNLERARGGGVAQKLLGAPTIGGGSAGAGGGGGGS
jgi:hypothetical protein